LLDVSNLMNCANVGMVQCISRTRLSTKSFQRLRVFRKIVRKKFQRNEAPELSVLCLIHHTHTATTEFSMMR
jgi:hypothetical protein